MIKYVMYFWVGRMGLSLLGSLMPIIVGYCYTFTSSSPTSSSISSFKAELEVYTWKNLQLMDYQVLRDPFFHSTPYLIQDAPVVNNATLKLLLQNLFRHHNIWIKVSKSKEFYYFSEDQLWSNIFLNHSNPALRRSYDYIKLDDYFDESKGYRFAPFSFLDFLKKSSAVPSHSEATPPEIDSSLSSSPTHYMYLAYAHLAPNLDAFAPSLYKLSQKLSSTLPQSNLWMASPQVTARMYYDYQDNFLLQITGRKQVLVLSPEATALLAPYPSLHPLWRQSSRSTAFIREKLQTEGGFRYWNLTLQPGDILYIPSGFYHEVTTEEDSVGINAWFPSPFSTFQMKALQLASPFLLDDPLEMKIAKVGILMKELCLALLPEGKQVSRMSCLIDSMQQRYQSVLDSLIALDDRHCDISEEMMYFCKPMDWLKKAGETSALNHYIIIIVYCYYFAVAAVDLFHGTRRLAHDLVRLLNSLDTTSLWAIEAKGGEEEGIIPGKDLKFLLLQDYLEELLQMAFASTSLPPQGLSLCMMEILLSYCWNYDYLKDDL